MLRVSAVLAWSLAWSGAAHAFEIQGTWETPAGQVTLAHTAAGFVGVLTEPAKDCPSLSAGMEVMKGDLLDDNFSGEVRLCLEGPSCMAKESFLTALLVVAPSGAKMSGAVERGNDACHAKIASKGGMTLRRAGMQGEKPKALPKPPPPAAANKVQKARALIADAAAYLQEGRPEKARAQFEASIAITPLPEAYNGIGVTHVMRREYPDALTAYKKAVEVDPNFGDSYYNMGCAYAQQDKKDLALKYLKLSIANGYGSQVEVIEQDEDWAPLRNDPRYQKLIQDAHAASTKAKP
jgi:hypothetical protein